MKEGNTKTVPKQLAKKEVKHLRIVENIVDFISYAEPGKWLDNTE